MPKNPQISGGIKFKTAKTPLTIVDVDEIKRMGIKNKNVLVTADPALTLEGPTKSELAGFFAENGIEPSAEFFGISVRPWQNNDPMFVKKIAEIA